MKCSGRTRFRVGAAVVFILVPVAVFVHPRSAPPEVKRPSRVRGKDFTRTVQGSIPLARAPLPVPTSSPTSVFIPVPTAGVSPSSSSLSTVISSPTPYPVLTPEPSLIPLPADAPVAGPTPPVRISIEVDEDGIIRSLEGGDVIVGEKGVRIEYKTMKLSADKVTVYVKRKEALAEGNVTLVQGENVIRTEKLRYDFIKDEGIMAPGGGYYDPWYGQAGSVETKQRSEVDFDSGFATTCDYTKEPHYRFQATKFVIYLDDKIVARNVVFYLGEVPIMWLPYYQRSLKDHCQGTFLYPGYRNKWGFFFLSGYHWCAPNLQSTVHLDYRYRRGWAYGLDGRFFVGEQGCGDWQTYYLKDRAYEEGDETKTKERYLAELEYRHAFPYRIGANLSAHYLSDAGVRRDYFQREYDADSQPKSFAYAGLREADYTISLEFLKRLNDFYKVNEKLPAAVFQVKEISLGETDFYYEGSTSYISFKRRNANEGPAQYEADRFDTYHRLSYSDKYFGWLNVFPAAGLRETFYTRGPGRLETADGSDVEPTPQPTPEPDERKNFWRRVVSASLGLSTSIYGIFEAEDEVLEIHKLRHVIEPFINYYFADTPTVNADLIYQFDSTDKFNRTNYTEVGLRNQLQTKRTEEDGSEASWTLIDLTVKTSVYTRPDKDNSGRQIGNLLNRLEVTPFHWLGLNMDAAYDTYQGVMEKTTLDAWVRPEEEDWWATLSYVYHNDKNRDRIAPAVYFRLNPKWAFNLYSRYDIEGGQFEEESITILRDLHCWDSSITLRRREAMDDTEIFLVFWIKAFSQAPLHFSN